jgi:ABC-type polar amino acid transport system ATPase subunit
MDGGRKVIEGRPRDVLVNPSHERLRSFLSRIELRAH